MHAAAVVAGVLMMLCAGEPEPAKGPGGGSGGGVKAPAFPHPVITEVLYAVPMGERGDANKDGKRDATGDEFIEVYNPHDKSIELKGYCLQDKGRGRAGALSFTFPALALRPGECAVVFNGNGATWSGPVGDEGKAPNGPNGQFGNAWVFTMRATAGRTALANDGDAVLLVAPDKKVVQLIKWGKVSETLPEAGMEETVPLVTKCSVQKKGADGAFTAHDSLEGGLPYSPGVFGKAMPAPATEPARVTEPNPRVPEDDKSPKKKKGENPPR